jgi:transposase InsO family protein
MKREAITRLTGEHSVRVSCRALGINRSSYYESTQRQATVARAEAPVVAAIKQVHSHRFKRHYGSPRMAAELRGLGFDASRHKTARLMRKYQLNASVTRRFVCTTDSKHRNPIAKNTLGRCFEVSTPCQTWCADITYLKTVAGWIYLAAVLDVGTRKWVGYAIDATMKSRLVENALKMALLQESNAPAVMHTDRGSQYAARSHTDLLKQHGISPSMSRKGNCGDNAPAESFFGTFKSEVGDTFIDIHDARAAAFDFFGFYNRQRRHSALGLISPLQFESDLNNRHILT